MFAIVFPGQGSQAPGMGKFLYDEFKDAQLTFEEGSDALGFDLKKLCFEGPASDLNLTHNTQPALIVTSIATARVLTKQFGAKCSYTAGHSVGEYAALVTSEVITFADAMRAVRMRGQAMQEAVPVGQGSMVAVMGLDQKQSEDLCQYVIKTSGHSPLSPANFNCPGQIVLSGSAKAVEWISSHFNAEMLWPGQNLRVRFIPLQVSAPFHCAMMEPAEKRMATVLNEIKFANATIPIVQNYTAQIHTNANDMRLNLIRQISGPVRWWESMNLLKEKGQKKFIECGHGKVISGLLKKIDGTFFEVLGTNSLDDLKLIEGASK